MGVFSALQCSFVYVFLPVYWMVNILAPPSGRSSSSPTNKNLEKQTNKDCWVKKTFVQLDILCFLNKSQLDVILIKALELNALSLAVRLEDVCLTDLKYCLMED